MTTPIAGAAAEYGAGKARQVGREARMVRIPTGNRQYQGVILAEFLLATLIVGVAPLARGKDAQDTSTGPSPYGVDDIKQLAGIGAVYFILALLSSGKHGRFAAWFGGLILVAIGLSQTTSGGLPAIFGIFQPAATSAGANPNYGAGLGQYEPIPNPAATTFAPVQNATGMFPVIGPSSVTVQPTPSGQPTFTQQVTQPDGTVATVYQGGPGVITTNTGTQLA